MFAISNETSIIKIFLINVIWNQLSSAEKSNNSYHHFSTPSLPLTIEIIISENDDNDGRPLTCKIWSRDELEQAVNKLDHPLWDRIKVVLSQGLTVSRPPVHH